MFQVGDKIRIKPEFKAYVGEGQPDVLTVTHTAFATGEIFTSEVGWLKADRFELVPATQAEAFDSMPPVAFSLEQPKEPVDFSQPMRLKTRAESPMPIPSQVRRQFEIFEQVQKINPDVALADKFNAEIASGQALRYNAGKPEVDYLFTYDGGVAAVWHDSYLCEPLEAFAHWYREEDCGLDGVIRQFSDALDENWPELLAKTQVIGAKKYAVGNYLKGANWRQYAQALGRHCLALVRGEQEDAEGNPHQGAVMFNLLMLDHCVVNGLGVDDRIRAPK